MVSATLGAMGKNPLQLQFHPMTRGERNSPATDGNYTYDILQLLKVVNK